MSKRYWMIKTFNVQVKDLKYGDFPEYLDVAFTTRDENIISLYNEDGDEVKYETLSTFDQDIIDKALAEELTRIKVEQEKMFNSREEYLDYYGVPRHG